MVETTPLKSTLSTSFISTAANPEAKPLITINGFLNSRLSSLLWISRHEKRNLFILVVGLLDY